MEPQKVYKKQILRHERISLTNPCLKDRKALCYGYMKKFFKWLLILIVLLVISLVVLINNPALIKGPVERKLSDIAGYPINLEGDLDLDLGRQPEITAKNIHISGPDWASHQNLLAIGHLSLSLDTGSLFEDIIVV